MDKFYLNLKWHLFFPILFVFVGNNGFSQLNATKIQADTFIVSPGPPLDTLSNFKLKNENASIAKKWLRAEAFIGGLELSAMGTLMLMPPTVTKWEPDFIKDASTNLKRAFTRPPVWDSDDFALNYIAHPYTGAIYYNGLRSQGATKWQSFVFSAAQSTFWEYVIEGVAERPSIQDLIVTPVTGYFVGEIIHKATINMRRKGFNFLEKVVVLILNPMYVANNGYRNTRTLAR